MMEINSSLIKPEWEALRRNFELDTDAQVYIAGGALLNQIINLPINDVDFFFAGITFMQAQELYGAEIQNYGSIGIARHLKRNFNKVDADLVFLPDCLSLSAVLRNFDCGICQIGWDGKEIVATEEFYEDLANKTITELGSWSGDHITRVRQKLEPLGFQFKPLSEEDKLFLDF